MGRPINTDDHWLTQILADAYLEARNQWPKKMKIFPSDLGGEGCPVAFWRNCRDYPKKTPAPGELLMWAQGSNLEDEVGLKLALALAKTGEYLIVTPPAGEKQHRMEFGGRRGKLDFLLRNTETGGYIVLEVKSKRGGAFSYLNEIAHNNLIQTRFYIAAVCEKYDTDDCSGIVIYVDREGQNFVRPFDVRRDDQSVLDSIEELETLRDGPEPPPMEAVLLRRENKGPDSLVLKLPWQVGWCSQQECVCKSHIGSIPDGDIVCKQRDDGELIPINFKKGDTKAENRANKLFDMWSPVVAELLARGEAPRT